MNLVFRLILTFAVAIEQVYSHGKLTIIIFFFLLIDSNGIFIYLIFKEELAVLDLKQEVNI